MVRCPAEASPWSTHLAQSALTLEIDYYCAFKLITGSYIFDILHIFRNEEGVGAAILESGIPREELFVVTKVSACDWVGWCVSGGGGVWVRATEWGGGEWCGVWVVVMGWVRATEWGGGVWVLPVPAGVERWARERGNQQSISEEPKEVSLISIEFAWLIIHQFCFATRHANAISHS